MKGVIGDTTKNGVFGIRIYNVRNDQSEGGTDVGYTGNTGFDNFDYFLSNVLYNKRGVSIQDSIQKRSTLASSGVLGDGIFKLNDTKINARFDSFSTLLLYKGNFTQLELEGELAKDIKLRDNISKYY